MNNFFGIVILIIISVGCTNEPWSKPEKNEFLNGCANEGGKAAYCKCFMNKIMHAYPEYEEWHNISLEASVELAGKCD